MFFRRVRPQAATFEEKIESARKAGFIVSAGSAAGTTRLAHGPFAADVTATGAEHSGLLVGAEIAALVDGGYQKFWRTPSGKRQPALAEHLKQLHAFEEDLKEALGLESLYNEALGTRFEQHVYDRVRDRDADVPRHPWERQL